MIAKLFDGVANELTPLFAAFLHSSEVIRPA